MRKVPVKKTKRGSRDKGPAKENADCAILKSQSKLILFNNCVAKKKLSAQDILEIPLLAASSKMETARIDGKT